MLHVAAGMEGGLEVDAFHRGVIEAEADDAADLVLVDAALNGGNQDDGAADLGEPVERAHFHGRMSGSPRMMR